MTARRHKVIMVPAGGYRNPTTLETLELRQVDEGMLQSQKHVHMDGAAIFNFTMADVPSQIEEVPGLFGEHVGFDRALSVASTQSIHFEADGGQDENSCGEVAQQHREHLRELQFGDDTIEYCAQLWGGGVEGESAGMFFGIWSGADMDHDGDGFGAVGGL